MDTNIISIGVFIDGGYYAKINEELNDNLSLQLNLNKLFNFIKSKVATISSANSQDCQITEAHFFRGRYRAHAANQKHILLQERKFEDALIENDVIFHYKHLREVKGTTGTTIIEKGIDVWYALETYELAQIRRFDFVVLITGDADHEMLIKKLKAMKINVLLLTWNVGPQSSTSPFLKDEATHHVELSNECIQDGNILNMLCKTSK